MLPCELMQTAKRKLCHLFPSENTERETSDMVQICCGAPLRKVGNILYVYFADQNCSARNELGMHH